MTACHELTHVPVSFPPFVLFYFIFLAFVPSHLPHFPFASPRHFLYSIFFVFDGVEFFNLLFVMVSMKPHASVQEKIIFTQKKCETYSLTSNSHTGFKFFIFKEANVQFLFASLVLSASLLIFLSFLNAGGFF